MLPITEKQIAAALAGAFLFGWLAGDSSPVKAAEKEVKKVDKKPAAEDTVKKPAKQAPKSDTVDLEKLDVSGVDKGAKKE